jgi:parallel beta-helix repeat protein
LRLDAGVNGGMSSTIRDCQLFSNPGPGIQVASDCLIVNNNLTTSGKGVFVTGSRCRIEGNNATACGKGFDIDGTGNIIVKNSAKGSTTINYEFPLGVQNMVGEIISGTITLDETHGAWANFEF